MPFAANVRTDITGGTSRVGVHALHHDTLATEVNAIETALNSGTGIFANPVGTAGGDLAGSYPNPTLASGAATGTKLGADVVLTTDPRMSDARTPSTHTHTEANVTNLTTDLAGKANSTHSHTAPWQTGYGFLAPVTGNLAHSLRPSGPITLIAFWARREGGTGAVVDVKKNGATQLTGTLSLTSGSTWMQGTLIASPALAAGDLIEFDVISAAGTPTEVIVTLDGTRTVT